MRIALGQTLIISSKPGSKLSATIKSRVAANRWIAFGNCDTPDGCRWHCRMPKSRGAYWKPKIRRNKARDSAVSILLRKNGWRVIRIWEHSLRAPGPVAAKLRAALAKRRRNSYKARLNVETFEKLLGELCARLTDECKSGRAYNQSKPFENRVREVIKTLLEKFKIPVDFSPHPYGFPDFVLGRFGAEVKFTTNDTWWSVANSGFESFRRPDASCQR
jgi:hypothetical protein